MEDALLMVATDRISAFDVIMREGLAGKGILLTQTSLYWFDHVNTLVNHHLVDNHAARIAELAKTYPELERRSMIVKKTQALTHRSRRARLSGRIRMESLQGNGKFI